MRFPASACTAIATRPLMPPGAVLALGVALGLLISDASNAEAQESADELIHEVGILRPEFQAAAADSSCRDDSVDELLRLLQALANEDEDQSRTTASVTASVSSDDARASLRDSIIPGGMRDTISFLGARETSKSEVGFRLSRGTYPGELSFETTIGVTLSTGTFTENVSRARMSYDHYLKPWLEGYVFLNRLSNDFLSLDQRYESGFGLVLDGYPLNGWDLSRDGWVTGPAKDRLDSLKLEDEADWASAAPLPWVNCYVAQRSALTSADSATAREDADSIRARVMRLREDALVSARYRGAGLRIALLVGLVTDLEQATIKLRDGEGNNVAINVAGVRTYRWEVRPTLAIRPRPLSFRVDWYYARAFAGFDEFVDDDVTDYRSDLRVQAGIQGDVSGIGDLTVTLELRRLFDNAPPFVTEVPEDTELPAGIGLPIVARPRYTNVSLKVGFAF